MILFTIRDMYVKSGASGFGHVGHGRRSPQSRVNINPPMRSRLIASNSAINSGQTGAPF
jgi:hypothetical protein